MAGLAVRSPLSRNDPSRHSTVHFAVLHDALSAADIRLLTWGLRPGISKANLIFARPGSVRSQSRLLQLPPGAGGTSPEAAAIDAARKTVPGTAAAAGLAGRLGQGLANLQFQRVWRDVCVFASWPFDTRRSVEGARRLFNRCHRPQHSVGLTFRLHMIPTGTTMKNANAFHLKG